MTAHQPAKGIARKPMRIQCRKRKVIKQSNRHINLNKQG